jgi:uncharacterized protein YlaN (UPF0358 family)
MKYEFIKVDEDTTKLKYKDKEFDLKKDIDLLTRLGSINKKAKTMMYKDLAKEGMTVRDLEIERHEGDKTIIDKSNQIDLEKYYLDLAAAEVLNDIAIKYTSMSIDKLLTDIGLVEEEENKDFALNLIKALKGNNSPRGNK